MTALLPLLIAIFGAVIYNLGAKLVPAGVNPLHFLVVVYLLAALISFLAGFWFTGQQNLTAALMQSGWPLALLALGVVCIEVGYILVYRAGGNVALSPIMISTGVMLVLLPIGALFFQQTPSPRALLGVALCLAGLALAAWK